MSQKVLTGWRYAAFIGALTGAIGLAIYPIIISPMLNPTPWKKMSKTVREENNIRPEDIQPGNMKIWTDPFDRPDRARKSE